MKRIMTALIMVGATTASGDWLLDWPLAGASNYYAPIMVQELFDAVTERQDLVGIAPLSIVETWATDSGNVTTTNAIGDFVQGSATGRTYLTRYFVDALTTGIEGLVTQFVARTLGRNSYTLSGFPLGVLGQPDGTYTYLVGNPDPPFPGGATYENIFTNATGNTNWWFGQLNGRWTAGTRKRPIFPFSAWTAEFFPCPIGPESDDWNDLSSCNPLFDIPGESTALAGGFDLYLSQSNAVGDYPQEIPAQTLAALFDYRGIGRVTNTSTNAWGYITNGTALWTRTPEMLQFWTLADTHYTGVWSFVDRDTFDSNYYDTATAWLQYYPNGTNTWVPVGNVTVTGQVLDVSDQSLSGDVETVTAAATPVALTKAWYSVSGITITNAPAHTGDVFAVAWSNDLALYGSMPYYLYVEDLDERWAVLDELRWTFLGATSNNVTNDGVLTWSNPWLPYEWYSTTQAVTWAAAKTGTEAAYGSNPAWPSAGVPPTSGTAGRTNGPIFEAAMVGVETYPYATVTVDEWSNRTKRVQFYVNFRHGAYIGPGPGSGTVPTWDVQTATNINPVPYRWELAEVTANFSTSAVRSTVLYGSTNQPPNWDAQPTGFDLEQFGYANQGQAVIEWDRTGGLNKK